MAKSTWILDSQLPLKFSLQSLTQINLVDKLCRLFTGWTSCQRINIPIWENHPVAHPFMILRRLNSLYAGSPVPVLSQYNTEQKLEMWANAQHDGRPAEYR